METDHYNDEYLTRYLLGELSEAEVARVEEACLSSRDLQEQLLVVEDQLLDDYAQDQLSASARAQFERHFLNSAARRERAQFARAWQAYLHKTPSRSVSPKGNLVAFTPAPARRPWVQLLIAATVLLAIGSAWLLVETARLRRQVEREQSERAALAQQAQDLQQQVDEARARSEDLARQLAAARDERPPQPPEHIEPEPTAPALVSFALTPGLVRDPGRANRLIIPNNAREVRLQLRFRQADYASYRAALQTVAGREALRQSGLKAQAQGASRVVTLRASANAFADGDYILTLEGVSGAGAAEVVAEYAFTIVKK